MSSFRSDLALLGLAVVGVLADLACVVTGHTPPALFEQVALVGVSGAAGVALPLRAAGPSSAAAGTQAPATYQAEESAAEVLQSPAAAAPLPPSGPVGQ